MSTTLGNRIKWAREQAGITQGELAERVGVAAGSRVSEWENDRRQPSAPVLMALPEVLGVSGHWLLTGQGERTREAAQLTADTILQAIQRILAGEIPAEVIRMLASPSATAYLTGQRGVRAPVVPEPAVPSAIMRRKWLSARIQHHEAPYYLEEAPSAQGGASSSAQEGRPEGEAAPTERGGPSIYEGGYVWGHLAH